MHSKSIRTLPAGQRYRSLVAATLIAMFNPVFASEAVEIRIEPQPLAAALAQFAEQSGVKALYADDVLTGKGAPRVEGSLTPQEALEKLLDGSGLRFQFIGDDAVKIEATPADVSVTEMSPIEVSAAPEDYTVSNASTGTKTDTPLMETPMAVTVIPSQVLEDQLVTKLDEALSNVSGVLSYAEFNQGTKETMWLRGFQTQDVFRDGVLMSNPNGLGGLTPMANVDRVEVLKGPAAILYGRMEPGGLVNLVTKKPQETPYHSLAQTVGSYSQTITTLDATGPANEGKSVLYRVVASYDNAGVKRDDVPKSKTFLAPSVSWKVNPDSTLDVSLEATHDRASFVNTNSIFDATTEQVLWLPRDNNLAPFDQQSDTIHATVAWTQQLAEDWSVKFKQVRTNVTSDGDGLQFGGFSFDSGSNTWLLSRFYEAAQDHATTDASSLDLTGHIEAGRLRHTVLVGADYRLVKDHVWLGLNYDGVPATDAFNPVTPPGLGPVDDQWMVMETADKVLGAYLQDQVELPHELFALAGLRYQKATQDSWTEYSDFFGGGGPIKDEQRNDHDVTPRFGLLWRATEMLSVYGSYTEGFGANNGWDWQHHALPAESAKQYELGAKSEWLDGKVTSTLAVFNLTKINHAVPDPLHGGFNITIGEIRSRGVEYELLGEVMPGWNLLFNYTYDDPVVTKSTDGAYYPEGKRMPDVPNHIERVATTYAFRSEALRNWKVGGAVRHIGSTLNNSNTDVTPDYTVLDAMASYSFKAMGQAASVQLNIKNLTDKFYYSSSFAAAYANTLVAHEGQPRMLSATVRVDF